MVTKHPSSVVMIPYFFYHAVLRVSFLLLALKSNWSPSHIDLILTASWHSESSPVCAPGCGSRRSFIPAPASSNSLRAHRHLPSLCPRQSILHTLTRLMFLEHSIHNALLLLQKLQRYHYQTPQEREQARRPNDLGCYALGPWASVSTSLSLISSPVKWECS